MNYRTVRTTVILGIFSAIFGWQTVHAQSLSGADLLWRDTAREMGKANEERMAQLRKEWERQRAAQLKEFDTAYQKELNQRERLRTQMTERSTGQHGNTGLSVEKQASIRKRLRTLGLD